MSEKHYSIDYLENTWEFLKKLKRYSYEPFLTITHGTVIDLGCGTGIDAISLAGLLGPGVTVIGMDHDPQMLDKAKSASGSVGNVRFWLGDASRITADDDSVSGLRAERLIQHLTQPDLVFQEIRRVLKSGHPLVLMETVWNSLSFYTQHIETEKKISRYLTDHKVKNGWAANKLAHDLDANQFRDIRLQTFCIVGKTLEEAKQYLWIDKILQEMSANGYLSDDEKEVFQETLTYMDQQGHFTCSMNIVMAVAVK